MKKITFFIYDMYTGGGIERVVSLIANEMSKKYEVEIISLYKTKKVPCYKLDDNIKLTYILEKELFPLKLYYPYLMYCTRKKLKNYKTDVFICASMGFVGLNIFMRKRAKYIAWEHANTSIGDFGDKLWLGRIIAAKYADKIVVLTKKDMKMNIDKYRTSNKIVQIYNPIEKINLSDAYLRDSKKIVSCGRFQYQKGFDMLVDVADKILKKHKDWEWHIYGDGPQKEMIENMIKERNLEKNLKLMGRVNNMNEKYKDYAMFVMTSRYEGFAMVNIEAHFAKLPIVSFNCNCGPDEIIQDGINGYLVDCFDTNQMAEKINYLIENSNVRIQMSQNTSLDKEKLDMKNIIKEWEKIL